MSSDQNTSQTEKVLENKINQKDTEIANLKKQLSQKKNSDDIAPGIRKTKTNTTVLNGKLPDFRFFSENFSLSDDADLDASDFFRDLSRTVEMEV